MPTRPFGILPGAVGRRGSRRVNERVSKAGWLAAAGLALFMAQAAQAETLTDALVSAYNNSHLLEQNRDR